VTDFIMFRDRALGKEDHHLILVSPLANSKLWWNHRASNNCVYSTIDVISGGNMVLSSRSQTCYILMHVFYYSTNYEHIFF